MRFIYFNIPDMISSTIQCDDLCHWWLESKMKTKENKDHLK